MRLYEARAGFAWSLVSKCPMRAVVILADPTSDRLRGFTQTSVFVELDLFLLQATVKALDQSFGFGVVVSRAAMSDAQA